MDDAQLRNCVQGLYHSHPVFSWEVFRLNFDDQRTKQLAGLSTPPSSNVSADEYMALDQNIKSCTCDTSPDGFQHLQCELLLPEYISSCITSNRLD